MTTTSSRPRHLTFDQFERGCASYVGRKPQRRAHRGTGGFVGQEEEDHQDLGPDLYAFGWQWLEHSMIPQLSHLRRIIEVLHSERSYPVSQKQSEEEEGEDLILSTHFSHPVEDSDHASSTYPTSSPASADGSHGTGTGTSTGTMSSTVSCTQEIFYSTTWSSPVLYLQAHYTQTGQTLSLEEVMDPRLGVFLRGGDGSSSASQGAGGRSRSALHALLPQSSARRGGDDGPRDMTTLKAPRVGDGECTVSEDDTVAPAYFPPLSLSDHPITSLPCISLHPCQTAVVIGEMMHSRQPRSVNRHGTEGRSTDGDCEESVYGEEYLEAFMTICASAIEMRG